MSVPRCKASIASALASYCAALTRSRSAAAYCPNSIALVRESRITALILSCSVLSWADNAATHCCVAMASMELSRNISRLKPGNCSSFLTESVVRLGASPGERREAQEKLSQDRSGANFTAASIRQWSRVFLKKTRYSNKTSENIERSRHLPHSALVVWACGRCRNSETQERNDGDISYPDTSHNASR